MTMPPHIIVTTVQKTREGLCYLLLMSHLTAHNTAHNGISLEAAVTFAHFPPTPSQVLSIGSAPTQVPAGQQHSEEEPACSWYTALPDPSCSLQ